MGSPSVQCVATSVGAMSAAPARMALRDVSNQAGKTANSTTKKAQAAPLAPQRKAPTSRVTRANGPLTRLIRNVHLARPNAYRTPAGPFAWLDASEARHIGNSTAAAPAHES